MSYVVRANWTSREGNEEKVRDALADLAPQSREEPGNEMYVVYQDPAEPTVFHLFEVYRDQEAYALHGASEYFGRYAVETAIPLLASRERAFFETVDL